MNELLTTLLALLGVAGIAHEAPAPPPAQVEQPVRELRRCPQCGWIESKREILPRAANPEILQVYEYTVRMRNGSSRVFREELPGQLARGRAADLHRRRQVKVAAHDALRPASVRAFGGAAAVPARSCAERIQVKCANRQNSRRGAQTLGFVPLSIC